MIAVGLLKSKIDASGLKLTHIADQMGLSRQALYKKLNEYSPFTTKEAQALSDILDLSRNEREQIFFPSKVDKTATVKEVI